MNMFVVKLEGPGGYSTYLPWDVDRWGVAGQEKIDELKAMDLECRGARPGRFRDS